MTTKLFRISAKHFVAGGELNKENKVVKAAPIISYMYSWYISAVRRYCERKNWQLEILD